LLLFLINKSLKDTCFLFNAADQLKQKMRGLVGYQANALSNPTSNRMDDTAVQSSSISGISVISKPAVLHEKTLSTSPKSGKV